jgi:hypothetical protein
MSKHSSLPSAAPFNLAFRVKGQFFSWLEEKGNEMRLKRFGHAMTGTAGWEDGGGVGQADGETLKPDPTTANRHSSKDLTGQDSEREALLSTSEVESDPHR